LCLGLCLIGFGLAGCVAEGEAVGVGVTVTELSEIGAGSGCA